MKMRFWIATIAVAGAMACALTLTIATQGTFAGTKATVPESGASRPQADVPPQTYEGMITDTRCGARHSAAIGKTATDCILSCVHGGEQFVLIDGDTTYLLEGDLVTLKQVAGQRVSVIGTLNGKRISVNSVVTTVSTAKSR